MNAKNKKLLAIVGVAAVLLIVIGVSVSMLGKGDQPSGTDPAAAPTDVTTEDVSQPPEEETTTPTVEVPDVSAPENTPAQEQADPVLDVEQEDQVDVDLTDREKSRKPHLRPPRPRRNSRRPARTMSRLFPTPPQTSPKTAIHRMAPSTLRASAGFPMKEAAPLGFQLGMMEMN